MKKTLLTVMIGALAASTAASAATVYDKDGTSLALSGRVQSVFYNGSAVGDDNGAGNSDSSIANSARISFEGRSELGYGIAAIGFAEWEAANNDAVGQTDALDAREQWIGVDFGDFGVLTAGRDYDTVKKVIEVTDIFEDFGCVGQLGCDDRRPGTLKYIWEGWGVIAGVSYQSAKNGVTVGGAPEGDGDGDVMDVEGGFSVLLGYTTPDLLFGPVSLKLGYSYLEGQDDEGCVSAIENMKEGAVSLTWGGDSGLYLGALWDYHKFELNDATEKKITGIEAVVAYNFECGLSTVIGWEYSKEEVTDEADDITRKIPLYINYQVNDFFNVWVEAQFDASSDEDDGTLFSVGARYTF